MAKALDPPELAGIRKSLAEKSLRHFIRQGWKYLDPADFVSNWHIDAMCEHLEAVARGDLRHLLINIPPRHMKSLSVGVAFPAWLWAQPTDDDIRKRTPLLGPQTGILALSYAERLSTRDNVKSRRLIESPWYQANWSDRFGFAPDQNAKTRFENDQKGYRIGSSIDGVATGEGGDVVLVDDPLSAKDANSDTARENVLTWWDETMSTRLNDPKTGAYIVVMQRLHEKDLAGHIIAAHDPDWTYLCLPARYEPDHPHVWARDPRTELGQLLWPERMGETEVSKLETSLGAYATAGQLQQRPAPRTGGLFQRQWFGEVSAVPAVRKRVRGNDFAATAKKTADYTAQVLVSRAPDGVFYIENVRRGQWSASEVEKSVVQTAAEDDAQLRTTIVIPQDGGQAGKAQAETYTKLLAGRDVRIVQISGDKVQRASPASAQVEAGNVKIVRTGDAAKDAWIAPFLDELCMFPAGVHDDQVDAFADALNHLALAPDRTIYVTPLSM